MTTKSKASQKAQQPLPRNRERTTETSWQTTPEVEVEVYRRQMFLRDLERATQITANINADPDEVRKLRAGIAEADAGKTRRYRRRATKSG